MPIITFVPLLNWINSNLSQYGLPLSFYMPSNLASAVASTDPQGFMIYKEGGSTYDMALAQIIWAKKGDTAKCDTMTKFYLYSGVGQAYPPNSLRAYYDPANTVEHGFIYKDPSGDDIKEYAVGERGYVFKLIDVEGHWQIQNPADGTTITWLQWQPVTGENAWIGIGLMHAYYAKHGFNLLPNADELVLAKEIARAAMLLTVDGDPNGINGAIRKSPRGSYDSSGVDPNKLISTENNLSMRALFSMLFRLTGENTYKAAVDGIDNYLRKAYNSADGTFCRGMNYDTNSNSWNKDSVFATDCQSWAVLSLKPSVIDNMFGQGAAYKMLKAMINQAGVFKPNCWWLFGRGRKLVGLDYTNWRNVNIDLKGRNYPIRSIEWAAGAVQALIFASQYYVKSNSSWSHELAGYAKTLEGGVDAAAHVLYFHFPFFKRVTFPYAIEGGQPTGHGWDTPPDGVYSLASTAWVALNKLTYGIWMRIWMRIWGRFINIFVKRIGFNPFFFNGAPPSL
jgi:hypothetical protein